jgi:hypothetical protein
MFIFGLGRERRVSASMLLGVLLLALASLIGACSDDAVAPTVEEGGVLLLAPAAPDAALERLLQQVVADYLPTLGAVKPTLRRQAAGTSADVERAARQARAGLVLVLDAHRLASDIIDEAALTKLGPGAFFLDSREVGDWPNKLGDRGATVVYAAGADKLSAQYALYELLRRLGARFYHPEQEYLPQNPAAVVRARARTATAVAALEADGKTPSPRYVPDFDQRSYTFHGSHPLEHLEAFSDAEHPIDEAVKVNDWIIKNRGNRFRGAGRGVTSGDRRARRVAELDQLRKLLGFPRGAGITLHNQQQGASAVVDPASLIPPKQQIEDYVAKRLAAVPDAHEFGIHFGPTELTTTPDTPTVQWINWAGQKALALAPGIRVVVNNHITGTQPVDNFDDKGCAPGTNSKGSCDYYDLSFHTDPRFAVKVHTVMFYPLEGPANVYNQKSFAHKLCLMQQASAAGRPLVWFPEGSWWLSYDNPIPVYLPLYIWTRYRDVELLEPLLKKNGGSLYAHRMFNSGHEWGYWQQDYAVGLLHWRAKIAYASILGELLDPLCAPSDWEKGCEAKRETQAVLETLIKHQRASYLTLKDHRGRAGALFAYMSGEDPADELGAATGLEFQPVRISFLKVAAWDAVELERFEKGDLATLKQWDQLHDGWLKRLQAAAAQVPEAGKPWFDEIVDGVEINLLRARQTHQLYQAVVTYRRTQLENEAKLAIDPNAQLADPKTEATPQLEAAKLTRAGAETVIRRREKAYRYPLAQINGGGLTPETAVQNGTTYPYRVHTKTHLLTYWNNREKAVSEVLDGAAGGSGLVLDPVFAAPGTQVDVTWPAISGLKGSLSIGSGASATTLDQTGKSFDPGASAGYFPVSATLTIEGKDLPLKGGLVRSDSLATTPQKGLALTQPESTLAQDVLNTLFPPLSWAVLGGGEAALVFAPDLAGDGKPLFEHVARAPVSGGALPPAGQALTTEPITFRLPIPDPGSKTPALFLELSQVVFGGSLASDGALTSPVTIKGKMALADLIDALVVMAGFDEPGAKAILASVLGVSVIDLPALLSFSGTLKIGP